MKVVCTIVTGMIGLAVVCGCKRADHEKVQLWENGPYWATTNIGAEKPWEAGYYFWWGDTVGYKRENNSWVASDGSNSNFSFGRENTPTIGKLPSNLRIEGWTTSDGVIPPDGVLVPEHDAAAVHWGNGWRMPRLYELLALENNCDWTWTTQNGINGYIVKGRGAYASNSIFLPAVGEATGTSFRNVGSYGYYWSSFFSALDDDFYAQALVIDSSRHFMSGGAPRHSGHPVRPLKWLSNSERK